MAGMLGKGRSGYFCGFGWRCRCERGGRNAHRRRAGRNVDASRRQLRRREARLVAADLRSEAQTDAGWYDLLFAESERRVAAADALDDYLWGIENGYFKAPEGVFLC